MSLFLVIHRPSPVGSCGIKGARALTKWLTGDGESMHVTQERQERMLGRHLAMISFVSRALRRVWRRPSGPLASGSVSPCPTWVWEYSHAAAI